MAVEVAAGVVVVVGRVVARDGAEAFCGVGAGGGTVEGIACGVDGCPNIPMPPGRVQIMTVEDNLG